MNVLSSLNDNVDSLPSLPAVALRIIQEVKKDDFSFRDLANIVSADPVLTARMLKIANSSFYALPYKVNSIDTAVSVLGVNALKSIALSFVIVTGMKKNKVDDFDYDLFWKRAITSAVAVGEIAPKMNVKLDDSFVTPLLMDIGILIMYLSRPDDYLKVFHLKNKSKISVIEAEKTVFGFDHQDVGGEILREWGIPDSISIPVSFHHGKKKCPPNMQKEIDTLALADMVSSAYLGYKAFGKMDRIKELIVEKLGISGEEAYSLIDAVGEKSVELLSFYEIDAGDMKPYAEILQEANTELSKLNLSYEEIVVELKRANKEAEELAFELWNAKERIQEMAVRDMLTGLFNHRYFQDLMDKEIQRGERFNHPLSFILIDIDNFKKINDTYGHLRGDEVLHMVGNILNETVRTPDTAARYGGEEFAVVLPETNIAGAVSLAERIRQRVEDMSLRFDDQTCKVTISLGIVHYDPPKGLKTKSEIIDAADNALYNSKATGKNKLSIASLVAA